MKTDKHVEVVTSYAEARRAHPHAPVVVCNSATGWEELIRGLTFRDGKPVYKESRIARASRRGTCVILDDADMLEMMPRLILRSWAEDVRTRFKINGHRIKVADGFKLVVVSQKKGCL